MEIKKQTDINDCGLVVLQSFHKEFHNKWIDINELKSRAYMDEKGINISSLVNLGKKYGVELTPLSGDINQLYESKSKEYMITTIKVENENHYVIIKLLKKSVLILDPIKGRYKLSKKEFKKIYEGIVILAKEIPFTKLDSKKIPWFIFKEPVLVSILITSILISITITFVSSIYMKVILDKIIPQRLNKELFLITAIFVWIGLLKVFNIFIKKYFSRKLSLYINYELTFMYINKIMNTNLNDLDKITKSDHLRRIALIENVSSFISNVFFIIFGDLIMMFLSIGILFWISTKLFSVILITGILSVSFTIMFNLFVKEEYDKTINLNQQSLSSSIEVISSYEQIKEPDYKTYLSNRFRKNYIKFKISESKIFWFKTWSIIWETIIDIIAPIVMTFVATKLVFDNKLTIGSMIMFISLFRTFLHPIDSITNTFMNMPIGFKNLNLLKYIFMLDNEKLNKRGYILKPIKEIKLENISFGYSKTIFDFNKFNITKNIKLTGKNGIGKTSFMKMLSARYDYEGKYFINNIELPFINKEDLRNRIYFSSNEYIPDVTIFEYITLLDQKRAQIFSENVNKYKLNNLLNIMGIDLSKRLQQNGSNISSGQLQVVKLLRLLTKSYDLILLDEATDNITSDVLKIISKAINGYQKGIFIEISHNNKYISKGGVVNFEKLIKN